MKTFATIQEIARLALPKLIDQLVFPKLVHRDFCDECHDMGDTVRVRKPVVFKASEFDETAGVDYTDLSEGMVDVKLDHIATVDAKAGAIEMATSLDDLDKIFVGPAVAALAEKINADGMQLYKDIPYVTGAAGVTPSELKDISDARKMLNRNMAPTLGRCGVWDPEADANFTQLAALVNAEKAGDNQALREGSIGRVYGIDNYVCQSVARHEMGTLGENTGITVKNTVSEAENIVLSGGSALSGKVSKGDILAIDGKTYTVMKDAEAANGEVNVQIYPALSAQAGANVTVEKDHTANLAFHPLAFAYVTRPLVDPDGQGVVSYVTSYDGISLRVTKGYDQKFKRSVYSMDVLYGFKTIYPELAVRVMG